jgi:hypothetical protein
MATSLRSRALVGALAAAVVLLAGAPAGRAFKAPGRAWPGGTIRYYNAAADQAWAVYQAADAWNSSGAHVRFVATTREQAQLVIRSYPSGTCVAHAEATLGFVSGATILVSRADTRHPMCNPYTTAGALAHELGHVLGLGHEEGECAAMNPSGSYRGSDRCPKSAPWEWRCRLLERDDVEGAVALYGGVVRKVRSPASCPFYEPIAAPGSLSVSGDGSGGVRVAFVRPGSARIPLFALAGGSGEEAFALTRTRNACAARPDLRRRAYSWSARAGAAEELVDRLPASGRYCYAVWAVDALGRPSARAAAGWLVVP